jgi:CheY-like chemotaxis protein
MITKKILLVEDDLFLRDVYKESLESDDLQIEQAVDGAEALDKIKSQDWDLILLDVVMPKMSGIDVVKELVKEESTKRRSIVFLTNSHDLQDQKEIKDMGYDCLLKSDITPADLISYVQQFLQKASA